jgi:exodeoxyribonuclease III
MKIATWNINGVKARIDSLTRWLTETKPDVVCLQEIKTQDEGFPTEAIEALGYNVAVHGQKGFHGVALLSLRPFDEVKRRLPGDDADEHSRYIEAVISTAAGSAVRVAGIYLPNGNPIGTEKFSYKLAWMERLHTHVAGLLHHEETLVVAGDYNVIATPDDCYDPKAWTEDALYQPESRAAFRRFCNLGMTDAIKATHPGTGHYTFWDYQAGAWPKDHGIRIDHLMLSPQAADRLTGAGIDRMTRGWDKPSDHVPVWVELAVGG